MIGRSLLLLTGATGFVGRHVAKTLLQRGYQVASTIRPTSAVPPSLRSAGVEWITKDSVSSWLTNNRPLAVVHLATSYATGSLSEVVESNVIFPLKLLEDAVDAGCRVFIGADTFFGKGGIEYPHMQAYTKSKSDLNFWARCLTESSTDLRIANLRLEHVYGAEDGRKKFVTQLIARLRADEPVIDFTPGDQIRDFVFVEDVADAFAAVIENTDRLVDPFTEIEVGTGQGFTLRHFVTTLARLLGSKSELRFGALPHRPFEIPKSIADITWLTSVGWKPSCDINTGIQRMLDQISASNVKAD